jgi:hypothetical protein
MANHFFLVISGRRVSAGPGIHTPQRRDYGFRARGLRPRPGMTRNYSAAALALLPIAAFTRGMTSSAISCIERLASAGSAQSMPA